MLWLKFTLRSKMLFRFFFFFSMIMYDNGQAGAYPDFGIMHKATDSDFHSVTERHRKVDFKT